MRYLANRTFRIKQPRQEAVSFETGDEVTCFGELPEKARHTLLSQNYVHMADGDLTFTESEVAQLKELLRQRRVEADKMPAPLRPHDGGEIAVEPEADADELPMPDLDLPDAGITADFPLPPGFSTPKKGHAKGKK